jgi:dTDP-4-amino-4,6-dideoxyglucose
MLEAQLSELLGVRNVVLVSNATLGLQLALRALVPDGEVILPSFTFAATAQAIRWCGLTPRFIDIDPETQQLDISELEAAITPQTRAIIPVHMWGQACDVTAIQAFADRFDVKVIYDAAHAFCSEFQGQRIGGFGDAEVFSFHATKFFNTFEGGAVTTNDDEIAENLRHLRSFGMANGTIGADGINAKMSEVHAAHGLCLLPELPRIIAHNNQIIDTLATAFSGSDVIRMIPTKGRGLTNGQYAILQVISREMKRDVLIDALNLSGITCRAYFTPPCHLHIGAGPCAALSHTEHAAATTIAIPSGMQLSVERARAMAGVILTQAEKLRPRVYTVADAIARRIA